MRHALSFSFDAREFSEDVIAPLNRAWRDRLPVCVLLRDACEQDELIGGVERIAATFAFVVIAGREIPIPAIRAVHVGTLVVPTHDCAEPALLRRRGRRGRRGCV